MKKLIVFMFSIVLLGSCSSKKTLSEQIKYDWDINYNSLQDNGNDRPYNLSENLKNSSVQNQTEHQISLPTVKNKQDLLASNNKVEPSVLTNNYSYKKLLKIIQKERINNSYLEKAPILNNKEITKKKSRTKDKQNKILKLIGTSLLIVLTIIIYAFTHLILFFNSGSGAIIGINIFLVLISTLFTYLSYKAVKNTIKAFSKGSNNNDLRDSSD